MRHGFVRTILIASLIIALEAIELVRLWSTQHASDADRFGEVNQQHYISYGEKLVDPVALFTLALVVSTLLLWQSTDKLWKAGERQIEVAEKSALAAIEAATATRDAVIVSTRPWLKVKADVGHQPFIVAPIGATYSVSIAFDNVGNAPAVNVSPNAWMFVWRNEFGMDPQTQHFRKCEDARLSPPNDNFTLFPSEKFPLSIGYGSYQLGVHVTRDDIDLAIAAGSATDNEVVQSSCSSSVGVLHTHFNQIPKSDIKRNS